MTAPQANPAPARLPRRPLVVLALVLASLGCRRPTPDPYAILRAASASYEGLRCYHVVWTTRTTSSKSPGKVTTTRMVMAAAPGGRFRREMAMSHWAAPVVDVSDGTKEWTYFADRKQFILSEPGAGPDGDLFGEDPPRLSSIGDSPVRQVRWLRAETVVLEGQSLTCDVIGATPWKTYWIERTKHRIVRQQEIFAGGSQSDTDYLLVHLNDEPPAALFVSPVPAGTERIDRLAPRGLPLEATWQDRLKKASADLEVAREDSDRFYALGPVAVAAFEVGQIDVARQSAQRVLDLAPRFRENWNYGNAVHDGHMVLGRVALRRGDLAAAKRELIEAGKSPGSPQLDTFGPNMALAKDLLEQNEATAVLEYFRLCGSFWTRRDKLDEWSTIAKRGQVPDFGRNLRY